MLQQIKTWLQPPVFPQEEDKTRIAGHLYFLTKLILSSSRKGLNMVYLVLFKETKNHAQA